MSDEPTKVSTMSMEQLSLRLLAKTMRMQMDMAHNLFTNYPPTPGELDGVDRRGQRTETISLDDLPSKLPEAIVALTAAMERVPEAYRETAELDLDSDRDGGAVEVSVSYRRPETDEEWAKRRADVERRQKLAEEQQAKRDRAEYERLRVKFNTPEDQ